MKNTYSSRWHDGLAMSSRALWICVLLLIGSAAASDVPFVFSEGFSGAASYTSAQIEKASSSSPDLAGVPSVTSAADNEIIEFPVVGGSNTPQGTTEEKVSDLKKLFDSRVEPDNSKVHEEAILLAAKHPGDYTIEQVSAIYNYLKNGGSSRKGWSYVPDPRGVNNFFYANETLSLGEKTNCAGAGDCGDFAILMSALVESIGGTTRIILAQNNSTGGHAYTEAYLGRLNSSNSQVNNIVNWVKQEFGTDKIYTHVDTDTKDVWLNLDWSADHPGGPFYQGYKHIVLCIRDRYVKTPLNLPENTNPIPTTPQVKSSESTALQEPGPSAPPVSAIAVSSGQVIPPGAGPIDWYVNKK